MHRRDFIAWLGGFAAILPLMSNLLTFRRDDAPEVAGEPLRYTASGLDDVYLLNGFKREVIDGDEYLTIEDLDGLWKAIGLHLVSTRKTLAPKEIRFLRQHMDMTQAELAAKLRVTDQTVARWEKGQTEPGPADLLIRFLFLGSDIAQPEGSVELKRMFAKLDEMLARDEPPGAPAVPRYQIQRTLDTPIDVYWGD